MHHLLALASVLPLALAAPLIQPLAGTAIPGSYIIKLKEGATDSAVQDTIKGLKASPKHVYRSKKFKGFSADLNSAGVKAVQALPEVCHGLSSFEAFVLMTTRSSTLSRMPSFPSTISSRRRTSPGVWLASHPAPRMPRRTRMTRAPAPAPART